MTKVWLQQSQLTLTIS